MTFEELERLVYNHEEGNKRKSIAAIIDFFDDNMMEGKFAECDFALRILDVTRLTSSSINACLAITNRAKLKLPSRPIFYKRGMMAVTKLKGWCYARSLLKRYR